MLVVRMGRGAEDARAVLEAAVRVLDEGWVRGVRRAAQVAAAHDLVAHDRGRDAARDGPDARARGAVHAEEEARAAHAHEHLERPGGRIEAVLVIVVV